MSGAMKEVLLEPADHRLGVMRTRGDVVHLVGEATAWVLVESGQGRAMCYLWALAGESMTLAPSYDPVHAWLASAAGSGDTASAAGSGDTA